MTDTTMGQRIAQRRKKLNLSQEAFGEKMGVSRQAISKWEADAAVPEIDKLIAMSKLFGVSVGWLLGTEEEPGNQNAAPEFTEEQLKIVEQIAEQYAQPRKKDRIIAVISCCCVAVMLVVCIATFVSFSSYVNRELGYLYSMLRVLNNDLNNIDYQYGQITDRLDKMATGELLLAEYTLEAVAWEDMTGATVRFTAMPNATQAREQAWLSVRLDGVEVANQMCTMDGAAYTASIDLPAANGYSYYFQVVYVGGDSAQQPLAEADYICENLESALGCRLWTSIEGYSIGGGTLEIPTLLIQRQEPYLAADSSVLQWIRMELVLTLNGKELARQDILDCFDTTTPEGAPERLDAQQCDTSASFAIPQLNEGDVLELSIEADLSNGTALDQPIAQWIKENGSTTFSEFAVVG